MKLGSIASLCGTYSRVILIGWTLIALCSVYAFLNLHTRLLPGGFEIPQSSSLTAKQLKQQLTPDAPVSTLALVVGGTSFSEHEVSAAVKKILDSDIQSVSQHIINVAITSPPSTFPSGETVALISIHLNTTLDESIAIAKLVSEKLNTIDTGSVPMHMTGTPAIWAEFDTQNKKDLIFAELFQIPFLFVTLLLFLGSFAVALFPLVAVVGAVAASFGSLYLLTYVTGLSIYVENVVQLIGIGVCIDYSLLIISRFRKEYATHHDLHNALTITGNTAGMAVVCSGALVSLALSGLYFTGAPLLQGFAVGTITVVVFAILFALTATPALLALYYTSSFSKGYIMKKSHTENAGTIFMKLMLTVTECPKFFAAASLSTLVLLSIPTLQMKIGTNGPSQLPPESSVMQARELISRTYGGGVMAPIEIVVKATAGNLLDPEQVQNFVSVIRNDTQYKYSPDITRIQEGNYDHFLIFTVLPLQADDSDATFQYVQRIKDASLQSFDPTRASVYISGPTNEYQDFTTVIRENMTFVVLFIITICFFALLVMFKSILIPLKAILMTMLSTAATLGILVIVFQYGYGEVLFGFTSVGHLTNWVLPFLICILFGLSIDYEVFILARIQELKKLGRNNRDSIVEGVSDTAPIITAAAGIMIITFLCFLTNQLLPMKETALGLAVAVFIDATLVRLILVPSLMTLAGESNWWLPTPLARLLSRVTIHFH